MVFTRLSLLGARRSVSTLASRSLHHTSVRRLAAPVASTICRPLAGVVRHLSGSATEEDPSKPPPAAKTPLASQPDSAFDNIPESVRAKVGRDLHRRPHHPLNTIKRRIEQFFDDTYTGFHFVDDLHPRVSTESCFDSLLVDPSHPSRQPSDTFYFDRNHCLRTHTSAHQNELMRAGHTSFLATGDCYRRDEIDASHYPVFHQMEGVHILPLGATEADAEAHLKEALEGAVAALFGADVKTRWVPAYFPFTDPSFELEAWYRDEWLEVLGCGLVQRRILRNCGVGDDRVAWAFGIGIERLAMVLFDIPDIRLFWTEDERFHRQFTSDAIVRFQPYSKYPPVHRDMSFWLPAPKEDGGAPFHDNDLCSVIRDTAGDLVEQVDFVSAYRQEATGRDSQCYRVTYRSMDRNLTDAEVNDLQEQVRVQIVAQLGVELR